MIQDFVDGKIKIKVTKEDIFYLRVLSEVTGLKFASRDSICGDYMIGLLKRYNEIELMATNCGVRYGVGCDDSCFPISTLFEPLSAMFEPQVTIEEDEIMSLLGD